MPIKRITKTTSVEIYDSSDQSGLTSLPKEVVEESDISRKTQTITGLPTYGEEIGIENPDSSLERNPLTPNIGRTFPDLIIEIKNDPSLMAIFLLFAPFIVLAFSPKFEFKSLLDFKYPLFMGIILNIFLFLFKKIFRSKKKGFASDWIFKK